MKNYEISFPDPEHTGEFRPVGSPMPMEEALAYVQEYYGADAEGRVHLIKKLPSSGDEEEMNNDE